MLIQCTSCQSKIRVPDNSAGKKGKCPKCGTILNVPAGLPAPAEVPEVDVREVPADPQAAFASEPLRPSQAPPIPPPSPRDDDRPSRRSKYADAPRRAGEDDYEDGPRRSRDDDYDDEPRDRDLRDDLSIRRSDRQQSTGMSLTAMILGIAGLVVTLFCIVLGLGFAVMCVLCVWGSYPGFAISGILGIMAPIFGFIGLKHGGKGFAWTGIITGGVNLFLIVVWLILTLVLPLFGFAIFAAAAANQPPPNFNNRPPNNFNQPPIFQPKFKR